MQWVEISTFKMDYNGQNNVLYMKSELLFPKAFIIYVFIGLEEKWIMSKNICFIIGSRQKNEKNA